MTAARQSPAAAAAQAGGAQSRPQSGPRSWAAPAWPRGQAAPASDDRQGLALAARIFLVSIAIPGTIPLGSLNLSAYRIVLAVVLLPCLARWLSGRAGPVRGADIAVLLFCLWYGISLVVTGGLAAAIEPAGITVIEVAGAYFLARCTVRNHVDFRAMTRTLFVVMAVLLPFAAIETFTGRNIPAELFGIVLNTGDALAGNSRLGLRRANSVFDHPIILGVAAAALLPLVHLVLGAGMSALRRRGQDLVIVGLTLLSLSSAPIGLTALLIVLMAWDAMLRSFPFRWHVVGGALVLTYLGIDILSTQTPVQFLIHYFTFDGQTGWYRLLIWNFGTASVAAHPLFGIGFQEWARPAWMVSSSIDNFWLVHFIRNGVPAGLFMLAAFGLAVLAVARARPRNDADRRCQTAYLLTILGLFLTGATVHFWAAVLVLLMFILGSGLWMAQGDRRARRRVRGARALGRRRPAADGTDGLANPRTRGAGPVPGG